jgi:hypothetical protein
VRGYEAASSEAAMLVETGETFLDLALHAHERAARDDEGEGRGNSAGAGDPIESDRRLSAKRGHVDQIAGFRGKPIAAIAPNTWRP